MFSVFFFFSSRRRHTRLVSDWSSDVCSSDLYLSAWVSLGRVSREQGKSDDAIEALSKAQIGRASCREKSRSLLQVHYEEKIIKMKINHHCVLVVNRNTIINYNKS